MIITKAKTGCAGEVVKMFVSGFAVESIMVSKHLVNFWQGLATNSVDGLGVLFLSMMYVLYILLV